MTMSISERTTVSSILEADGYFGTSDVKPTGYNVMAHDDGGLVLVFHDDEEDSCFEWAATDKAEGAREALAACGRYCVIVYGTELHLYVKPLAPGGDTSTDTPWATSQENGETSMNTALQITTDERYEIQDLLFKRIPHLYNDLDQAPGIIVVKRTYPASDGGAVDIVIPIESRGHIVYVAALLQYCCGIFSSGDTDTYDGDFFSTLEEAVSFWQQPWSPRTPPTS